MSKRKNFIGFAFFNQKKKINLLSGEAIAAIILLTIVALIFQNPGFGILLAAIVGVAYGLIWKAKSVKKKRIDAALLQMGKSNPMQLSHEQYENFCGLLLEQNGWKVSYTKKTGDQGADVIAEKQNRRVIVQCKQWSSSVGNQAVQEVHAACSFYRAQYAQTQGIVVATAGYTSGARDLASKTGVLLMSHMDLVDFYN